jgi:hypothetical protein
MHIIRIRTNNLVLLLIGIRLFVDSVVLTTPHVEYIMASRTMEHMRMPGVEPGSQAWEACMMPLHYMRLIGFIFRDVVTRDGFL